jgi:Tfp pilus assembly protein PilO
MKKLIQKIKLPDNLELDNKKIMFIVLICAVFVYLDFALVLSRQLKGAGKLKTEIVNSKKALDKLNKDLVIFQQLKSKQIEAADKSSLKNKKIIKESEIVNLLQAVSSIANKSNVQIEQMKSTKDLQQAKPQDKFTPLLITLDLVADYHRFGKFINELENDQIFIAVQSFRMSPQAGESLKQRVNLVLRTYVMK